MSYKIGRVYRIICQSNPDIQYVGSTFNQLRQRFSRHKINYKRKYLKGEKVKNISIWNYFHQYGIDDFKIILIKEYTVCAENSKDHKHLSVYEQLWINKIKCVNIVNCFVPQIVKNLKNKITRELYYKNNKSVIRKKQLLYSNKPENRERDRLRAMVYNEKNMDKIRQKDKTRVICECGIEGSYANRGRHKKSNVHKIAMLKLKT